MKKIIFLILFVAILTIPLSPVFACDKNNHGHHSCQTANWSINGDWGWQFTYTQGGSIELYNVVLDGVNTTGVSPMNKFVSSNVIVNGNIVSMTGVYWAGSIRTGNLSITGTINPDGTMSGTWSDDFNSGSGTWISTSGKATGGTVCTPKHNKKDKHKESDKHEEQNKDGGNRK